MPGQEMRMSGADWPKASQMPRCTMCFDLMTAPESSVLMPDGVTLELRLLRRNGGHTLPQPTPLYSASLGPRLS